MSSNVTLNGVQYVVPAYNDTGWAQGVGNLSLYLVAIASNTLQPTGGAFTLTSELDFGANFGVKQLYLKSETANPASAGVVRLASADTIKWRNNANGADIALSKDASDNLQYNATKVLLSGAVVNADINAAAAIAYSKLALTGSIVNADINAAAAIALTKLAALGANKVLTSDVSGFIVANPGLTTDTELGYVHGVTSAIQTQLGTKAAVAGQQFTGNISFNASSKGIVGDASGGNAASGNVGEYLETLVAGSHSIPGTNNAWGDVTSLALTAGDWLIFVNTSVNLNGASGGAFIDFGISSTSGNSATGLTLGQNYLECTGPIGSNDQAVSLAPYRVSIASPTTYYFKLLMGFTVSTPIYQGAKICAVRIR